MNQLEKLIRAFFSVGCSLALCCALAAIPGDSPAETFPEDGVDTLQRVLAAEEFQPRGIQLSATERIKLYVINKVKAWFVKISDKIPFERFKLSQDSWLTKFLKWIASGVEWLVSWLALLWGFSRYLFIATVALLLSFIVYRIINHFRNKSAVISPSVRSERSSGLTLQQVAQLGETEAGLISLRNYLRQELKRDLNISPSLTDRELLARSARIDAKLNASKLNAFRSVTGLYERFAFARLGFNPGEYREVLDGIVAAELANR